MLNTNLQYTEQHFVTNVIRMEENVKYLTYDDPVLPLTMQKIMIAEAIKMKQILSNFFVCPKNC